MHIRKLELQGFKSFPDHTTLHFDDGVSGVVGPNGCGKSNIVDAVLWCLGEQSPRVLRGRSMDDVIFAGSVDRPAMSVAEVSITFGASEEPFPGDLARCEEIQIARRLYRDGHSEYFLNNQKVRLKDLHDLFLDTGVGNRMYCVIEQGRIGEIVNARPEQRRTLIEEAAGISRYKARRKEAEGHLDETLRNLERVTDVVEEQSKRLKSLERQVEKATRFRRLRTRVRQAEIYLGLARFAAIAADRRALAEQLRGVQTEEENLRLRLEKREADIAAARAALEQREATVGRLRDRLAEVEASRREQESARQYQAREQAELQRRMKGLDDQRSRAEKERDEAAKKLEEAIAERDQIAARLAADEQRLTATREESESAERAVTGRRRRIEEGKAAVMARVTEGARARATREALAGRRQDLQARLAQTQQRQEATGADVTALAEAEGAAAAAEASASAALDSARAALSQAQRDLEARERARTASAAEAKRTHEAHARADRAEQGLRARLESLSAMQARHEGVEDGVKAALATAGSRGTLAENLDVPEDLESLVAVALGEALDFVLVVDEAAAVAARAAARGRVGVVVLDGAVAPKAGFAARIQGTDLGRAALGRLLGDCGEAEDLRAALALSARTGGPTLSACGALVRSPGVALIGAPGGAGTAALARRRQIAALAEEIQRHQDGVLALALEASNAISALEAAGVAVDAARGRLEQARVTVGEAELALRDARHHHRERAREHLRQRDASAQIAREASALIDQTAEVDQKDEALASSLQGIEAAQMTAESALQGDQAALGAEEVAATRSREALASLRAELAGLTERLAGVRRAEAASRAAQAAAERLFTTAQRDLEAARERSAALAEDDARLEASLQLLGAEQAELRTTLDAERQLVRQERAALAEAENGIRDLRERREEVSRARMELERQILGIREEIGRIRDSLEDRYQISVAGLLDRLERDGHVLLEVDEAARGPVLPGDENCRWAGVVPVEDLRLTARSLEDAESIERWVALLQESREALAQLGEVNLVAVQEFLEVAESHRELEAQRQDLDDSVRTIRQTIARLNRTCRERFRETFDRVDATFRELYPALVGGGQARLALTNEEDLLETGVEIYVQPPGKRLQHLSLLSGGETAMCAIALLFSLFRVKPSPFCLLDEVDAPLDEGNGARFNGLLKEMSGSSQFIVITHNKKTMECMDTLYGITMPAPGVSRLVTVRMNTAGRGLRGGRAGAA